MFEKLLGALGVQPAAPTAAPAALAPVVEGLDEAMAMLQAQAASARTPEEMGAVMAKSVSMVTEMGQVVKGIAKTAPLPTGPVDDETTGEPTGGDGDDSDPEGALDDNGEPVSAVAKPIKKSLDAIVHDFVSDPNVGMLDAGPLLEAQLEAVTEIRELAKSLAAAVEGLSLRVDSLTAVDQETGQVVKSIEGMVARTPVGTPRAAVAQAGTGIMEPGLAGAVTATGEPTRGGISITQVKKSIEAAVRHDSTEVSPADYDLVRSVELDEVPAHLLEFAKAHPA